MDGHFGDWRCDSMGKFNVFWRFELILLREESVEDVERKK